MINTEVTIASAFLVFSPLKHVFLSLTFLLKIAASEMQHGKSLFREGRNKTRDNNSEEYLFSRGAGLLEQSHRRHAFAGAPPLLFPVGPCR